MRGKQMRLAMEIHEDEDEDEDGDGVGGGIQKWLSGMPNFFFLMCKVA